MNIPCTDMTCEQLGTLSNGAFEGQKFMKEIILEASDPA
jgi:hypothetical protein